MADANWPVLYKDTLIAADGTYYLSNNANYINSDGDLAVELATATAAKGYAVNLYGVGTTVPRDIYVKLNGYWSAGTFVIGGSQTTFSGNVNFEITSSTFVGGSLYVGSVGVAGGAVGSGGTIGNVSFTLSGSNKTSSSATLYVAGNNVTVASVSVVLTGTITTGNHFTIHANGTNCNIIGNVSMYLNGFLSSTNQNLTFSAAAQAGTVGGDVLITIGKDFGSNTSGNRNVAIGNGGLVAGAATIVMEAIAEGDIAATYKISFSGNYKNANNVAAYANLIVNSYTAANFHHSIGITATYKFANVNFIDSVTDVSVSMHADSLTISGNSALTITGTTSSIKTLTLDVGGLLNGNTAAMLGSAISTVTAFNLGYALDLQKYGNFLLVSSAWNLTGKTFKVNGINLVEGAAAVQINTFANGALVYGANGLTLTTTSTLKTESNLDQASYYGTLDSFGGVYLKFGDSTITGNLYAGGNTGATGYVDVTIVSGSYNQIFAGSRIDGGTVSAESMTVNISGGSMARIYGGAAVMNAGSVSLKSSEINITGPIFNGGTGAAIWTYAGGIVTGDSVMNIAKSAINVTAAGDVGNFVGGGRVDKSGSLITAEAAINITQGNAVSVIGGGYISNGGTAKVTKSAIAVGSAATAMSVFAGGFVSGTVNSVSEVGNSIITVSGTIRSAVYGGSYLEVGTGKVDSAEITVKGSVGKGIYGGGYVEGTGVETVNNVSITLAGGDILSPVFGGAYTTGSGSSTVKNVSITLDGATLTGNIYAGGFANGSGSNTVENVSITLSSSYLGTVYSTGFSKAGSATVGSVTINFAGYEGNVGDFAGDFSRFNFDSDCMDIQFGDDFTFGSGLINVESGTYDSALNNMLFDVDYGITLANLRLDDQTLVSGAATGAAYTLVWDTFTSSLFLVGQDNVGDYSDPAFKLFHVA